MARAKKEESARRRRQPATSPEAREQEIAASAYDLAAEQIEMGTASSQVITHFLKMGSTREVLERQRLAHENELTAVKIQNIEAQTRIEELYVEAIGAMRSYRGSAEELPDELPE